MTVDLVELRLVERFARRQQARAGRRRLLLAPANTGSCVTGLVSSAAVAALSPAAFEAALLAFRECAGIVEP